MSGRYGSQLIKDEILTAGNVLTVFFSIIMGSMAIGQATPSLSAFAVGQGAAVGVFKVLDRKSKIDALSEDGLRPESVKGVIKFHNVSFAYPSRPLEQILSKLNLEIDARTTVALVGERFAQILFFYFKRIF